MDINTSTVDVISRIYDIDQYWDMIKNNNPSNTKPYHNLWHITCVTTYCHIMAMDEGLNLYDMKILLLAAMFHDYGHFSKDDSLNIRLAKDIFSQCLLKFNGSEYYSSAIQQMEREVHAIIDATKYPYEIPDDDLYICQRIIRDADLLQWTEPTIIEHVFEGLSKEMSINIRDFLPRNKKFIKDTLTNYRTDWAKNRANRLYKNQMNLVNAFEKTLSHHRIILVARAASGKDFLRNKFIDRGFIPSISMTTRPPRDGEINGKDYIFISREDANRMIQNDEFYEYVEFNGWLYGTTKEQFNTDEIFIMTPSGISKIKPEDRENCFIIFLDIDEGCRRDRLNQRVMPGDTIDRRLKSDENDFKDFTDFDMRVTNSNF